MTSVMASTSGKHMEEEARVSDSTQFWWSNLYRSLRGLCCSSAASSTPKRRAPATSWYHSARIQDMMERRGEFSSEMEATIAASEVTWSEVDGQPTEHSGMTNRESFEVLKPRKYFRKGDEIGFEGGSVFQHLEKQIPPALLHYHPSEDYDPHGRSLPKYMDAVLLTDERLG